MATFYLMRHGEPEITGVMLGQMDPRLSAAGRTQAANFRSAAAYPTAPRHWDGRVVRTDCRQATENDGLSHIRKEAIAVEVVWTSPLRRARETADLIRAQRVVEIAELREIDCGAWSGKTWAEIESNWGDLASRKASDWLGIPAPGGETWGDFLDRIRIAWNVIRNGPSPAAIVGHQGVNAALLHLIDGRNPLEFNQRYGEVIRIDCH